MSFSVTGSGHGVDPERAQAAFAAFVRAIDAATAGSGDPFEGEIAGGEWVGDDADQARPWSLSAAEVRSAVAEPGA
jgi:hypothetical protein